MTSDVTPERLRYFALYWDKVALIDTNNFYADLWGDAYLLQKAGIVTTKRGSYTFAECDYSDKYWIFNKHFEVLSKIASELIEKNPGQWAIDQNSFRDIVPAGMKTELLTVDFELNRCLPTPKPELPMEKLLDFKLRRKDELHGLRQTIDELYLEVSKSQDIPRSKIHQLSRLEQAIKDLDQVAKQSWGERILASRKVSLDIGFGSIKDGLITAGLIGASFNSPIIGGLAGAGHTMVSSMKFEVSATPQLNSSIGRQLELSYLSALKGEKII
ncbi:DUF6236 family protein [Massilia sp.]|uniref:DUF6236 family protein n=1 Tax=Massilia sp. TaxID=1882437 RepID=UPI0028A2C31C|nr:DUF6236 family protein [Massilia sp.]